MKCWRDAKFIAFWSCTKNSFDDLIDALYDGSDTVYTETEVTYEDGRKGQIKANLDIRDATVVAKTKVAA